MALRVAPKAASDLDAIWERIAAQSGEYQLADEVVTAETQRFFILGRHPHLGRARDSLRPGLRSFPASGHLIIYNVGSRNLLVLRVIDAHRDIRCLMSL